MITVIQSHNYVAVTGQVYQEIESVMSRMTSYAMEINYQGVLLRLVLKH
jgi:hypothetical protein